MQLTTEKAPDLREVFTTNDFQPSILIVDDEPRIRQGCQETLVTEGYDIHLAASGAAAEQMIADRHFDIILLDLMMPGLSGFDVLSQVHALHPDTVVIVITGYATIEHSIRAMKNGAFDFVPKPFSPDQLRVVVAKAIEYNRALKDIAQERSRLRVLINHLGDGVMATDHHKNLVLCNPAFLKLTGAENHSPIGKPLGEICRIPQIGELVEDALKMPADEFKELSTELPTGEDENGPMLALRCVPLRDRLKRNRGTIVVLQDITALKKLDQMKSDFVSQVSHEIRSPLNTILSQLKVVLDGLAGDVSQKQKEILEKASKRILALSEMTADLLNLAKLESGLVTFEKEALAIDTLLTDLVNFYIPFAEEKRIRLTLELDTTERIIANQQNVEQVLSNLISNAIRYTPSGGQVTVVTTTSQNYQCISVRDSGIGIADEDQKRIFDRFYRVKSPQTRMIPGTGLGLGIVRQIMEAHQGKIQVTSEPGKGSNFEVFFPIAQT